MTYMLVRNKIEDYNVWRKVFDADKDEREKAGLITQHVWQEKENKNNVFFLLSVEDIEKAETFCKKPESQEKSQKAGVIEGEYFYLEKTE